MPSQSAWAKHTKVALGLACFTLIGALLRLHRIDHSLWLDEFQTVWIIGGTQSEVASRAAVGNQGPLYFYLAQLSVSMFGLSEAALRLPSLISGIAFIPVTYFTVRLLSNSTGVGFVASGLVALDSMCIFYSQDARPYSAVQLFGLVQFVLYYRLLISKYRFSTRVAFIACTVVMLNLHVTTVLFLVAELAFYGLLLVRNGRAQQYQPKRLAFDIVLIGLFCLPVLPGTLQAGARKSAWLLFVPAVHLESILTLYPVLPYLVLPFLAAFVVGFAIKATPHAALALKDPLFLAAYLCCGYLVPVAIGWTATGTGLAPVFYQRYLLLSGLVPVVACALVWSYFPSRSCRITYVLSALVLTQCTTEGAARKFRTTGTFSGHNTEDWRGAIEHVRTHLSGSSPVFVRCGFVESNELLTREDDMIEAECLAPVNSIYSLGETSRPLRPLSFHGTPINDRDFELVRQFKRGVIMFNAYSSQHAARFVQALRLKGLTAQLTDQRFFKSVAVFNFRCN